MKFSHVMFVLAAFAIAIVAALFLGVVISAV